MNHEKGSELTITWTAHCLFIIRNVELISTVLHFSLGRLNHDSTFHTFSEKLTAGLIDALDGAAGMISIGRTAAGAVKLCPAVFAVGS